MPCVEQGLRERQIRMNIIDVLPREQDDVIFISNNDGKDIEVPFIIVSLRSPILVSVGPISATPKRAIIFPQEYNKKFFDEEGNLVIQFDDTGESIKVFRDNIASIEKRLGVKPHRDSKLHKFLSKYYSWKIVVFTVAGAFFIPQQIENLLNISWAMDFILVWMVVFIIIPGILYIISKVSFQKEFYNIYSGKGKHKFFQAYRK